AIDYYEAREVGLGYDFALEVSSAIQRIVAHPRSWPVLDGDVRRCQTNRFPYGVLYAVEESQVLIVAVMHLRREPEYWKHRKG
ncbi:MAG: type II toxin-antitoxin system RelE/ParE family toxin, partial [Acidobacteriota bacterium]